MFLKIMNIYLGITHFSYLIFIVTHGSDFVMLEFCARLLSGLRLTVTWPRLQGDLALSLTWWLELAGRCGGSLTSTACSPTWPVIVPAAPSSVRFRWRLEPES